MEPNRAEYTAAPKRFSQGSHIPENPVLAPVPPAAEFVDRRRRLCERIRGAAAADLHQPSTTAWWAPIGKDPFGPALVLVRAAPPSTSSYRQHNDLYYLSGIEVSNAYLEIDTIDAR